ncbi:MAG: DCC1-like thiol-disulfide oxidoreductase family protein [Pseudonocardia sp.]
MVERLVALYDAQCEICQAGVSWIRALDLEGVVECRPLQDGPPVEVHPDLDDAACRRELHVVDRADGRVHVGWAAVTLLASTLPFLRPLGAVGAHPAVARFGDAGYRTLARNRHALSVCRGGSCATGRPPSDARPHTGRAFWSCRGLGLAARLPLIAGVMVRDTGRNWRDHLRTARRRIVLRPDELELWFLGGLRPDVVPLLYGERFTAVWYRGALVDPGSTLMRRSLDRHLDRHGAARVAVVTATHAHEEHVGNLEWAAARTGARLVLPSQVSSQLRPAVRIPRTRAAVIGQPPALSGPVDDAGAAIELPEGGRLAVLPAPGHSPDHVVLWDDARRTALVGDSFMGAYFSSPNPDVDSRKWITTLERLLDLDVEVMVEGHGHVHSVRRDIRAVPGVVVRSDPRAALEEKLGFLRWLAERIELARDDGAGVRATVATCFPWGRRASWERFAVDGLARFTTLGHFSRTELVRSFHRVPGQVLPTVLEARFGR